MKKETTKKQEQEPDKQPQFVELPPDPYILMKALSLVRRRPKYETDN